ncbi:MAG TPA: branched-chain amino acid ABC transporter permease [Egicoccus sp.]|nr:branched-chain amino acid ABC transporter permease [Egicoccus sp.]HSK23521.1 branched-chain amino acid ABC transporter permease [Egicoccus sp.]
MGATLEAEVAVPPSRDGSEDRPRWSERMSHEVAQHRVGIAWSVAVVVVAAAMIAAGMDVGAMLVNGLGSGAIYALVALGIALVYRATRVLNFAQGELGTMPAFLVVLVLLGGDLDGFVDPAQVSFGRLLALTGLAVVIGAAMAVAVNLFVIQRLADSSPVTSLVATAGVALLLIGVQVVAFDLQSRTFPQFFSGSVRLLGLRFPSHTLVVACVLLAASVLLVGLFRTQLGVALLASAQDPFAAELHGVSARAMSSLAWGLAGGLAALGGVLGAGVFEGITPGLMTSTFLIPAFTAAVLGGITSPAGAVVGGLLLGQVSAAANTATVGLGVSVPNAPTLAAFVVLLLVLVFRPLGLLGTEG